MAKPAGPDLDKTQCEGIVGDPPNLLSFFIF
jgi:hypothetical protein